MIRRVGHISELIPLIYQAPIELSSLIRNRRISQSHLRRIQNKKLRSLIKHSYKYVPYYHQLFRKSRIKPDDIKTIDDISKIPITKKEDIRNQPTSRLFSSNFSIEKCLKRPTSGTTGTPLVTYSTIRERMIDYMNIARWQLECGTTLTDKRLSIGLGNLVNPLLNKLGLAVNLSPIISLRKQIEEIKRFKPKILLGYPSCLTILSQEIREKNIQGISVETVYTSGEMMDHNTRRMYQEVFNAEVFDGYGSTEVGGISTECVNHSGYHIWADSSLVEIIKNDERVSDGEEGEVVVTQLNNHAMPFIRYNVEDLAIMLKEKPSCGNLLPLMKITGGRSSEIAQLPGEEQVPVWELISFLLFIDGIKRFQLIQEQVDKFRVIIAKNTSYRSTAIEQIEKGLRSRIRQRLSQKQTENIKIKVEIVKKIPREKSGKFKYFVKTIS